MDYHSTKQKMVSLLFILAFGCSVFNASASMPVTHADSWEVIKTQLSCDDDLAKEVRHLLMSIDDAIFQYLHYNGHEKSYATHIGRFNHHLTTLKFIIERHEKQPERANAVKVLKAMHKNLTELIKEVNGAKGSKGMIAAISLGKKIDPLINNFKGIFPSLTLTVDDKIRAHYSIQDVDTKVLLGHLQKRLEA
jgi:hypothetical protein